MQSVWDEPSSTRKRVGNAVCGRCTAPLPLIDALEGQCAVTWPRILSRQLVVITHFTITDRTLTTHPTLDNYIVPSRACVMARCHVQCVSTFWEWKNATNSPSAIGPPHVQRVTTLPCETFGASLTNSGQLLDFMPRFYFLIAFFLFWVQTIVIALYISHFKQLYT